jgi:ATP-dependent RNA helicase DHX29
MAPNKKKKKAVSNPARGFATVSTPSKKTDEEPEQKDTSETPSSDGKPASGGLEAATHTEPRVEGPNLQNMTPEELEQHLEDAELQSLLDLHGQRSKKDVTRQVARLETERRSLRRSSMMLEAESWLPSVIEEILDLARSSPKPSKKKSGEFNDTNLCVKLWNVQQTLDILGFRHIEGALRHLMKISTLIPNTDATSLIWGLDEAMNWLALYADQCDLPPYQQQHSRLSPPASRPRSPTSANASGESIAALGIFKCSLDQCLPFFQMILALLRLLRWPSTPQDLQQRRTPDLPRNLLLTAMIMIRTC